MADIIDLTNVSDSDQDELDHDSETERDSGDATSESNHAMQNDILVRTQLLQAIRTVSDGRLRDVVINLMARVPAAEQVLVEELVNIEHKTTINAKKDVIKAEVRWEICENCEEEFDASEERADDECSFHPGHLRVDEESFEDWDDDCHGPMDTAYNRKNYPENFKWTCCGESTFAEGCVEDTHVTAGTKKRKRL